MALCILICALIGVVDSIQLKVATYNIANYNDHGNWSERVDMISNILLDTDADIIAMQEPRFDPDEASSKKFYQNQAEEILYRMTNTDFYQKFQFRRRNSHSLKWPPGASIVTQPSMYYPLTGGDIPLPSGVDGMNPGGSKWEGSSIIARRRILETGTRFLTRTVYCEDTNLRATQMASFDVTSTAPRFRHAVRHVHLGESNILYVFNTHFGLEGPCLMTNVQETIEYMEPFHRSPILLVGDMNAPPDHPALKQLAAAGFVDLWQKLYPKQPGYTFGADYPIKRIDYGWANKYLVDAITNVTIFGKEPASDGTFASDHLGLLFTFNL